MKKCISFILASTLFLSPNTYASTRNKANEKPQTAKTHNTRKAKFNPSKIYIKLAICAGAALLGSYAVPKIMKKCIINKCRRALDILRLNVRENDPRKEALIRYIDDFLHSASNASNSDFDLASRIADNIIAGHIMFAYGRLPRRYKNAHADAQNHDDFFNRFFKHDPFWSQFSGFGSHTRGARFANSSWDWSDHTAYMGGRYTVEVYMDKLDALTEEINKAISAKTDTEGAIADLKAYFNTQFVRRLDGANATIGDDDKIKFIGEINPEKIQQAFRAMWKLNNMTNQNSQVHGMVAELNFINRAAKSKN